MEGRVSHALEVRCRQRIALGSTDRGVSLRLSVKFSTSRLFRLILGNWNCQVRSIETATRPVSRRGLPLESSPKGGLLSVAVIANRWRCKWLGLTDTYLENATSVPTPRSSGVHSRIGMTRRPISRAVIFTRQRKNALLVWRDLASSSPIQTQRGPPHLFRRCGNAPQRLIGRLSLEAEWVPTAWQRPFGGGVILVGSSGQRYPTYLLCWRAVPSQMLSLTFVGLLG